jgi:hypothetical protein
MDIDHAKPNQVESEQVIDPVKPKRKTRINYALAGTLLTTGLSYDEIAPQVGAKNGQSVRIGLFKKGVTLRKVQQLPTPNEGSMPVLLRVATQAGQIVRDRLSKDLEQTTNELLSTKQRKGLKALKERVEVLEPLTRTASKLYGWEGTSSDTPVAMLFMDQDQSIEVQSSVSSPDSSVVSDSPDTPQYSQGVEGEQAST